MDRDYILWVKYPGEKWWIAEEGSEKQCRETLKELSEKPGQWIVTRTVDYGGPETGRE